MRLILLFAMTVMSSFGFADAPKTRKIHCNTIDSLARTSQIKFDIDTGVMTMKGDKLEWDVLYSQDKACGLKIDNPQNCVQRIWHSFDNPDVKDKMLIFNAHCKIGDVNMKEMNGSLEINRFGDGTGVFVCGLLSRHEVTLSDCRLTLF